MSGGVHDGRVAIVTGGASGIGRAAVDALVAGGARVVAVDLQVDGVSESDDIAVLAGDVTDPDTNAAAVAVAMERFGRLDAVAFNAGVPMSGDLLDLPIEQFDRCLEVNVRAVVIGLRAVVPALRAGGGGRITVTASTSGIAGDPNMWPYNTAKAAAINLVRGAALELARDAITVNAVCPGPTETGMTAGISALPERYEGLRRAVPLQRWGQAAEVAAAIDFLLSPAASFITGAVLPVDGGIGASTGQFTPHPLTT
ncbi:MAG: SDR family oxidoreductase [Actinobacteria bacterium]|nr:SDR family oxidoreductase [Actinomycetota bacterium]